MAEQVDQLLFVGGHDASCSAMAAAFANATGRKNVVALYAGVLSGAVDPLVWRVLSEVHLFEETRGGKRVADLGSCAPDLMVALSGEAAEACRMLPGNPQKLHWNITEPSALTGDADWRLQAFREARDVIRRLVDDLYTQGGLSAFLASKHEHDLVLDHLSEGVIAHDLNRRIFYFNAAAERITGYKREELLNRDCHDVLPGGLCGAKCSFCHGDHLPESARSKDLEIVTRSGDRRRIHMNLVAINNDRGIPMGVLGCFRDLTTDVQLAQRLGESEHFSGIVGRDPKMLALYDIIPELAESAAPVLVQGESGTGKELVAAALHNEGPRVNKLFVPVNCGALPEGLLESELFGHVKGAFTGAIRDKKGRFELADGGTIFLDEIGDISPAMQVKLLRVLQEGRFEQVGSEKTIKVNVRVVSATHRDLIKEMAAGRFREDLFYRLSVVPLVLPPLRERLTDIPLLASHFLKLLAGSRDMTISPDALDFMMSYNWPGNVRELQNWIQFALIKCKTGPILLQHLPPIALKTMPMPSVGAVSPVAPPKGKQRLTPQIVHDAIERAGSNKVEAAKALGVSRATLYRFMDKTGPNAS
jgi:PAS domain S-box-containing protein